MRLEQARGIEVALGSLRGHADDLVRIGDASADDAAALASAEPVLAAARAEIEPAMELVQLSGGANGPWTDTWRAVRLLKQSPGTADDVRQVGTDLRATLDRIEGWHSIAPWLPTERELRSVTSTQRVAFVEAQLARDSSELTNHDWRRVHMLLTDPSTRAAVDAPIAIPELPSLDQLTRTAGDGSRTRRSMKRYFDAYQVGRMPLTERVDLATSLFTRPARSLSKDDWTTLLALLDHPPTRAHVAIPERMGPSPVRRLIAGILRHAPDDVARRLPGQLESNQRSLDLAQRYFDAARRMSTPEYRARLSAALDDVAGGTPSNESRELVKDNWFRIERLVAGRSPEAQVEIALLALDDAVTPSALGADPSRARTLASSLSQIGDQLRDVDVPAELLALRDETIDLVDRNVARMDGTRTDTFGTHPDYAEVGRIRVNVELLGAVRRAVPTNSVEVLTW